MVKKIFKLFWSYDIKKTESWLHSMALEGYRLKAINTTTRLFLFEENEHPQEISYHIEYRKKHSTKIPIALKKDGWERIIQDRKWYVLSNKQPAKKRKTFPLRDGVIRRNRFMLYLFGGMSIYTILTSLFFIIMCGIMLSSGYSITIQPNVFWITTMIIGVLLWTLAPYSTIYLYKRNHKYW